MAQALNDAQRAAIAQSMQSMRARAAAIAEANQKRETPQSVTEIPGRAWENLPASTEKFFTGVGEMVTHPVETVAGIGKLILGAPRAVAKKLLPPEVLQALDSIDVDPAREENTQIAERVGQMLLDRWGSWDAIKRTLANDPVGAGADIATVMMPIRGAAEKALPASRITSSLRAAENVANPFSYSDVAIKGTGAVAREGAGLASGMGPMPIQEAVQSGMQGGRQGQAFRQSVRNQGSDLATVDDALAAVQRAKHERAAAYETEMTKLGANQQRLDIRPVTQAFNDLWQNSHVGGHRKISDEAFAKLNKLHGIIDEWYKDPSSHTVMGFDALKQRIGQEMPSGPDPGFTGKIVTNMYNAVKGEIVKQAPEYGDIMRAYETASQDLTAVERELSLGTHNRGPNYDAALRKLTSLTRNNAATNYGARERHAAYLEQHGADTIRPAVAGMAGRSWTPRGIGRMVGGLAAPIAAGAATLPFAGPLPLIVGGVAAAASSPRLVSEIAHKIGQARRFLPNKRQQLLAAQLSNYSRQTPMTDQE